MAKRLILDNIPWIAPSVAIVLAASGYFDRSDSQPAQAAVVPAVEAPAQIQAQPQTQVAAPAVATRAVAVPLSVENVAAAAAVIADVPRPVVVPQAAPQPVVQQPVAQAPIANVTPVSAPPAAAAPQVAPIQDAAAFFNAAQARLAQSQSCFADLESLAERTRIYFPSGGLTGSEEGMAAARVIGLVAQECPGVSVEVRGHSDPSGDARTNLVLSQQRAEAIITRLSASGIDTSRFVARGMGDAEPSGIRGPQGSAFYDRRVDFAVVRSADPVVQTARAPQNWIRASCAVELETAVQNARVFYQPGSIMPREADWATAFELVQQAADCPQARLRVVGQHATELETFATGRLRAITLMSGLVSAGFDSGEIIIAAPSVPTRIEGAADLSESRVDFDIIFEDG